MTGLEWWALAIGGGGLASLVSVWLTHKRDSARVEIDWYDRATAEVKRLEAQINEIKEENKSLQAFNQQLRRENQTLRDKLNDLELTISKLKERG